MGEALYRKLLFEDKRLGAVRGGGLGALAPNVLKRRIFGHCAPNLIILLTSPFKPSKAEKCPAVAVGGGWSGRRALSAVL